MNNKGLKVMIAGGGTGGHIFPAVAIANAIKLQRPDAQFLFVGAKGKMEMEKIPQAGFQIIGIDIAGFNRSSLLKNIGLPFKLIKSFIQVRKIFKQYTPDLVLGVGGYSTFPVLKYAQSKGIHTFIHESNSFAGKANKMLAKNVTKAYVAAEGMDKFFPASKIVVTGNPVRNEILQQAIGKADALKHFGLLAGKKTILSIGGSLGAKSINESIAAHLNYFQDNNLQLIWQTGKPFAPQAQIIANGKSGVFTKDFIKEMDLAYAAADVVISRAGAMAIAELCAVAKPAILVPYPHAAENHQTVNAQYLVDKNAALMVADDNSKDQLITVLATIINNESKLTELKQAIAKLSSPKAADAVATDILNSIN